MSGSLTAAMGSVDSWRLARSFREKLVGWVWGGILCGLGAFCKCDSRQREDGGDQ